MTAPSARCGPVVSRPVSYEKFTRWRGELGESESRLSDAAGNSKSTAHIIRVPIN
jgi:hypothetical protein